MPGPACPLPSLLPHDPPGAVLWEAPLAVSERLWWMLPSFRGVYSKQDSSCVPAWLVSVAVRIL